MGKDKKEEKKKVSVKQTMSYDETVSFLETLLESFKAKKVVIHGEEDCIAVVPADEIQMEIKAKVKKNKVKMKMEFGWYEESASAPGTILGAEEVENIAEEAIEETESVKVNGAIDV